MRPCRHLCSRVPQAAGGAHSKSLIGLPSAAAAALGRPGPESSGEQLCWERAGTAQVAAAGRDQPPALAPRFLNFMGFLKWR